MLSCTLLTFYVVFSSQEKDQLLLCLQNKHIKGTHLYSLE